ncbi:hypothetical protein ES319_A12G057000v1 [Gossypium barbadense]|uniref:Uncharacterized protein n=1 Tax=Gossypium barbadense TaxID=3634 RepID=A0A5J5T9H2_GOSBA|nr:hypothetical protein ES319_A12G057000v1 [Gossypium barbadense]
MVEEGDSKAVVVYMDQNKVVEEVQEVVKKREAVAVAVDPVDGDDEGVREEEVQHSKAEVVGVHHISAVVVVQKDLVVVAVVVVVVQKGLEVVGRAGAYETPSIGRI